MRVLLVDDSAAIRAGVSALLGSTPDLTLVGSCADGARALTAAGALSPDIVLMDIAMPGLDGIAATVALLAARPATKVIILTASPGGDTVRRARDAGAAGLVAKAAGPAALLSALRAVAAGGTVWPAHGDTSPRHPG